ncbi:transmembrane emp24 domain-containing protein 7 [Bactrocera neohumeralis]|uniref:transmembrane emp24 domain-containing protein 7 n=1 Tax=Bactrocera tryoni TaxID=59916 RepID=UPI001A9929A7|nr:transmembrane emp24 domain-containing protein 7 [Bactrocera tryoni]XP_050328630.1 transmembrane emp24 domain-containing protein 7 [Bactrocera neohumeralis]
MLSPTIKCRYVIAYLALMLCVACRTGEAVEFTFDLADNSEDCFFEEVRRNTTCYLEFQVSAGGQLDVDVTLTNPHGKVIYEQQRATFDSHQFTAEATGVYKVCFSNQFSSFSHKIVYVDFQVGDEPALPGIDEHATVLTQMETSSQSIHKSLNDILDAQTHHRLSESKGRKRAEDLNEAVMMWSGLETCIVLVIGFGQILILRNFFSNRKTGEVRYNQLR